MGEDSGTGFVAGLEDVVAVETYLSDVDGEAGELTIAGFPVEELAGRASFEETVYLLWNGELPDHARLEEFREELAGRRGLPRATLELLGSVAAEKVPVMDALRMAAGTVRPGADEEEALSLVSGVPTIIAAYWRMLGGEGPIAPDPGLGHTANYLYMLSGEVPGEQFVRALETYFNAVSDHGMNASTFVARAIVSTRSDFVSAVVGAIGALKGPLHGGAPGPALDVVFEIGESGRAEEYLREKLGRGERLMGFGHRIYRVRDPRADVLAEAAGRLYTTDGDRELYALALDVEQTALRLLAEHRPGRNLQTNVEFYTALLLHGLGLPAQLFTPTFAAGRVTGWTAHCFEQRAVDRLIRPRSEYVGAKESNWVPLGER